MKMESRIATENGWRRNTMREVVEGHSWISGSAYKSTCHLRREPLAIKRVVYREKDGRLVINYKGNWIEVYTNGGRYYEKEK